MSFAFNRALAIVPARGGSKRLPRKNLRLLGGKPLVCHTLEAAIGSQCFKDIWLSSDDAEILALAARYEQVDARRREAEWAGDRTTIFSFLHHLVKAPDVADKYDAICLMLPTVPFRTPGSVRAVAEKLTKETDSAISVCRYDFPPQFGVYLDGENGEIRPAFDPSPLVTGATRSQDQAPIFHPNGAVYFSWVESYRQHGTFYRGRCRGVEMDAQESVDIDTEADLDYAEFVLQNRNKSRQSAGQD